MAVFMVGVLVYFYPVLVPAGMALGLAIGVLNVAMNSAAALIGRAINRAGHLSPLTVTVVSMGIGSSVLLGLGLATEDFPRLSLGSWGMVVWLAVVNTALAFTLWNHVLRTLTAAESSIINNTMLIQIAALAWLFLGEQPGPKEWLGMAVVTAGVLMVNLRKK
jgi:drug/metabolite transporter (DMT)-like permease